MKNKINNILKSGAIALATFLLVAGVLYAATTVGTNMLTTGTLGVTSLSTLGNATSTGLTLTGGLWLNGYATTTAANGNFATAGTLAVTGDTSLSTASSTGLVKAFQLKVGSPTGNPTMSGMVFGYCNIPSTAVTATSSNYAVCSSATGVLAGDLVFVQATSSMAANIIVEAASSTAADTISLRFWNPGNGTTASTNAGPVSLNFWAVR